MDDSKSWKIKKLVIGVLIAMLVITGGLWVAADWALRSAIKELNKTGQRITADQVRQQSLKENATALAGIDQPDLLLHLPAVKLKDSVLMAMKIANETPKLPITTTDTEVTTADQVVSFSTRVDGTDPKSGVVLKGRLRGLIAVSFVNNDLLFRPAVERIELEDIRIPGWNWFPGQIVSVTNPVIARFISEINGGLAIPPTLLLPPPTPAVTVKLGTKDVELPAVEPRPPALMVDASGVQALAQLVGPTKLAEVKSDLAGYQQSFKDKARRGFPETSKLPAGVNVADALVKRVLGSLANPGELDAIAAATIASNAKVLAEMSGPDVVLRLSAAETQRLIVESIAKSLSGLKGEDYVLSDVKHSFENGIIGIDGKITANIKFGKGGNAACVWSLALGVVPSTEPAERVLYLSPKVAAVRLESVTVSGGAPDFAVLAPTINGWLEALRLNLNKLLPRVPIALPAVSPDLVELKPIEVMGGRVSFTPDKVVPPAVAVSKALIAVTPDGLWILADIDAPGLPARAPLVNPFPPGTTPTFNDLDAAIARTVQAKYGDLPQTPLYGFASWNRFAAIFNASWDKVAPNISGSFDTGTVQMATQKINLMDYARFSCGRTRNCTQGHCQQRNCSQSSCSRDNCGSCRDWDVACKARKAICDVSAETRLGICNAGAATAKAACDTTAAAEKARCDGVENARLLACNAQAEAEVAFCEAKKGLTNGLAEVSGVGAIGGDSRLRGSVSLDVKRLALDETRPGVSFAPVIDGKITGNIGIDWTPYDVMGHVFVCPTRGKVFAEATLSFPRSQANVVATVEQSVLVEGASGPATTGQDLLIKVNAFRFPVKMQPGLLNALYAQNPHIVVTCPVAAGLLGVTGLIIGNSFKAISESNINAALAAAAAPTVTGALLLANENDEVRAGMAALFGGSFFIPVAGFEQRIHIPEKVLDLPGGSVGLKAFLSGHAFKFEVRETAVTKTPKLSATGRVPS